MYGLMSPVFLPKCEPVYSGQIAGFTGFRDQITKSETVSFYDNISYNVLLKLCREQVVFMLGVNNLLLSYWFVN